MSKRQVTRTLRCLVSDTERFERMVESVLKDFPNYIKISDQDTFQNIPESYGCHKLLIKAYNQSGELEIVQRYYKPKQN